MGMTLFLYGKDVSSGGITLYTQGPLPATGEIPLFTHGIDSYTRPMNLVIVGEAPRLDSSITLFIANSGVAGYVPLFIQGSGIGEGSVPYERGMNLFLKRDPAEAMTLFLQGPGQPETSSIPLFISAAYASSGNITLAMPNVLGYLAPHITLFTRGW
jgi:hypothetical protein